MKPCCKEEIMRSILGKASFDFTAFFPWKSDRIGSTLGYGGFLVKFLCN